MTAASSIALRPGIITLSGAGLDNEGNADDGPAETLNLRHQRPAPQNLNRGSFQSFSATVPFSLGGGPLR